MESKPKVSDHFIRLGMSAEMKEKIERWRGEQAAISGSVPFKQVFADLSPATPKVS